MDNDAERQNLANIIESTILSFDHESDGGVRDELVIRIIECLLDFYHFKQPCGKYLYLGISKFLIDKILV
jgi:hypothetical protein